MSERPPDETRVKPLTDTEKRTGTPHTPRVQPQPAKPQPQQPGANEKHK